MAAGEKKGQGHHLQQAHQDAYRAYLRSMKESLGKMDVEAVDLTKSTSVIPPTLYSIATYYTWYTYYSYHSYGTYGTSGTIATEACIQE